MVSKTNSDTKKKAVLSLSNLYKRWYFIAASALLLSLIIFILKQMPFFQDIENRALDYRFKMSPLTENKVDDVVIIAIDDSSLRHFVSNHISWPWPRDYYAVALDYFRIAGAKGVIFDVLFNEPDYNADEYDDRFAEAMSEYNKTVLAALMLPGETNIPDMLSSFSVDLGEEFFRTLPESKGISAPIDLFLESSKSVGSVNIIPDSDGVIRRVPLFIKIGDYTIPQLSMSALFLHDDEYSPESLTKVNNNRFFNGHKLPTDNKGNYLINWYGDEGADGVFHYYPFRSVIQSFIGHQRGQEPVLPFELFKDKYVIIGATAPGLYDLKTTPISQIHPGMEIWATILSNFLNNDFITQVPEKVTFIYLTLISFLLMMAFVRNPLKIGNILLIIIPAAVLILPVILWTNSRTHLPLISPLATVILSFMYITMVSYVSEGKSKREIKKAFSRYLHPQIIEQLMDNPDLVDLEGKEFEATMIFSDIYNFTNFSEKTDPKTLIVLLNKYFETLTGTILDNDGMLDKFMGDGLMAVFGAPLQYDQHPYNACKAALTHKKTWQKYADKNVDDFSIMFHVNTRLGINTGPVVAGNMGSVRRVDYTVIGDAVNLAARLESINKQYKTDIIISEFTYAKVYDKFICRELDSIMVKGKEQPTKIYELIDFAGSEERSYKWIDDYLEALNQYRLGNWDKAIKLFAKLSEPPIKDKPAKIMLDRCIVLKENTPQNWKGVFKWEVK